MFSYYFTLGFNSRSAFRITISAAPVSLSTAFHKVSQPGKINANAINLTINENQTFCLIIVNVLLLNSIVEGNLSILSAIKTISAVSIALSVPVTPIARSEEHTSELQSRFALVCRLLLAQIKS